MPTPPTAPPSDPRLPYALQYAAAGWPVYVLGRSKRPLANCPACRTPGPGHDPAACTCLTCHGFYAASTDPDRIRTTLATEPRGLLAVPTGAISRTVVIDIDPRNGGRYDPHLMPITLLACTAGGGLHLYYRYPDLPPGARIPSRPLPGVPGVDVKADGGCVVVPPSTLSPDRAYGWAGSAPSGPGRVAAMVELPPALTRACLAEPAGPPARGTPAHDGTRGPHRPCTPRSGGGGISNPGALLDALTHAVTSAQEGRRRFTLYGAARRAALMVAAGAITDQRAWHALTTAARAAQQSDRDTRTAILGAFQAEGVPTGGPYEMAGR